MAEIIDVLTPDNDNLPQFTVNNAVNYVNLSAIGGLGSQLSACNGAFKKFVRGDNFIILSVGYFIPEAFRIFEYLDAGLTKYSAPIISLFASAGGAVIPITQFGNNGELKLPFPNYEMSIGVFIDTEKSGLTDPTFILSVYFPLVVNTVRISMVGVPVALNGLTFKVTPFIKVLHNFPITA